ncbi:response regulator [Magnetococcales bacterium HHB-1]
MKRVLIVDDMATVRMFHRQILEQTGFAIEEAGNGVEGLEKALQIQFDLVLADVNMPKMDGYRMIQEMRAEKSTRHLPIIMISTESQPADRQKAFLAGANFYMVKPVTPDFLSGASLLMTGV